MFLRFVKTKNFSELDSKLSCFWCSEVAKNDEILVDHFYICFQKTRKRRKLVSASKNTKTTLKQTKIKPAPRKTKQLKIKTTPRVKKKKITKKKVTKKKVTKKKVTKKK